MPNTTRHHVVLERQEEADCDITLQPGMISHNSGLNDVPQSSIALSRLDKDEER